MGPYPNNRLFGQTMKKSNRSSSSSATRYQRQFGSSNNNNYNNNTNSSSHSQSIEESKAERKATEAAARRRLRQEQGETIDANFGYHRLEDQYHQQQQQQQQSSGDDFVAMQRRGWLFHMLATTVSNLSESRHIEVLERQETQSNLNLTAAFVLYRESTRAVGMNWLDWTSTLWMLKGRLSKQPSCIGLTFTF
jgi:hypothetical protein